MKKIDKIYNSLKDNKHFKNLSMDKQGKICMNKTNKPTCHAIDGIKCKTVIDNMMKRKY